MNIKRTFPWSVVGLAMLLVARTSPAEQADRKSSESAYAAEIQPLLKSYCYECHSGDVVEAELDLGTFKEVAQIRPQLKAWQKVSEMLASEQMPPKEAKQPTSEELAKLKQWVHELLAQEAAASAGDPGPVVLRRLNNAEYAYTLRDLTGIATLDPAKEFPVDSGAGEGFTNVGNALVMSPTLVTKYLDAAKEVAGHAVLLPHGIRFSAANTRRDWTNEMLAKIRQVYEKYTAAAGGSPVNLQGVQFDTNQGGRLPVEVYLEATLEEREAIGSGRKSIAQVARQRRLSAKYLDLLWQTLNRESPQQELPLDALRSKWRSAKPGDGVALAKLVAQWQSKLWKFNTVGQIGRAGAAKKWMEAVSPVVAQGNFRLKIPAQAEAEDVVLYLTVNEAGGGTHGNFAVWNRPRFVVSGRSELLLRDAGRAAEQYMQRRDAYFGQVAGCLDAAAEASRDSTHADVKALAEKHGVDADLLAGWFQYLGIEKGEPNFGTLISQKAESVLNHEFVQGWTGDDALSVLANSSDQDVQIPGLMPSHSVAVHPAPKFAAAVGWRSPVSGMLQVSAVVTPTHPACGNGIVYSLELRRGGMRLQLAEGLGAKGRRNEIGPFEKILVQTGDVISLFVDPRGGDHACDLTYVDLTVNDGTHEWNLGRDVSADILAGNPHADRHGNESVWQFYSIPTGNLGAGVPRDSLLAKWMVADKDQRVQLAEDLQKLLQKGDSSLAKDSPDGMLYRQLTALDGPFLRTALQTALARPDETSSEAEPKYGLQEARFGKLPDGTKIDAASIGVQSPSVTKIRLPANLIAGAEFVVDGSLPNDGSAQFNVLAAEPQEERFGFGGQLVASSGSAARKGLDAAFEEFRELFPVALCYTQIVPVDEVITLSLFYREDEPLRRLMLTDRERESLDRDWEELFFIAQEPLQMVTAFDQLSEFATQDRPDIVKELAPMRQPIHDRAAAFRQRVIDCEPAQIDAVVEFASQAFRRPLRDTESQALRAFYSHLRSQELPHDEACRLMLARVLVSPEFLYRLEKPGSGKLPVPVTDWELASRLSYFFWSSQPDAELGELAQAGKLHDPEQLAAQARRMMRDPKSRRLATEFGCQWLHIADFEHLDEKSERHFPTFAALRGAMQEESILFLADLFQNDRSVLNLLDADYTFLNDALAGYYGIPGVDGPQWRRVDGVRQFGRGGILALATVLAKQSGASRTSPVLRGAWISEVLLGEKLPRPPKNVPQLADAAPEGLTERQLFERHSQDAACMKCHARIDPFGFALENYDAIGRFREQAGPGVAIDAKAKLPDGTEIEGLAGLRNYLLTTRRDAFVRQFNRKLLGYALGRAVQLSDEPLLAEMQAALAKNEYRVSTAVELIVRSPQFCQIRGAEAALELESPGNADERR